MSALFDGRKPLRNARKSSDSTGKDSILEGLKLQLQSPLEQSERSEVHSKKLSRLKILRSALRSCFVLFWLALQLAKQLAAFFCLVESIFAHTLDL